MTVLGSFVMAFSRFSKIPMPYIEWKPDKMTYVFCFWPFIGLTIGLLQLLVFFLCDAYNVGAMLRAAVMTAVPILFTGGIHIKGFMATQDMLAMHESSAKLLAFMEQGHIGFSSMVHIVIYTLLSFCSYIYIDSYTKIMQAITAYVLSRALGCVVMLSLTCVKKKGIFYTFYTNSNKFALSVSSVFWIVSSLILLEIYMPIATLFIMVAEIVFMLIYVYNMKKRLGGVTGDTVDYFQYVSEMLAVVMIAVGSNLMI